MSGIRDIYLLDYDEKHEPPDSPGLALRLTLVDDVLFVAVGKREENANDISFKELAGMGVKFTPFCDAVNALNHAQACDPPKPKSEAA